MHIELTKKEFRRLLDMVYIGNWVLNSTRGDDRIPDYDHVESKIFAQCLKYGMPALMQISGGELLPSRAFMDGGIHEAIMDYEDTVFFEILAEELARRDMDFAPIGPDNYRELVYPLPVEALLYVGPATARKLRAIGISTIGRLACCPEATLVGRLGKMGAVLRRFANGLDDTPVLRSDHIPNVHSVGNSATTPRDLRDEDDVRLMLLLLAESVCSRMRELAARCTTVELSVRDADLRSFLCQRKLPRPSCASRELADTARELFRERYRWSRPVRSIGLRGSGLVEAVPEGQLSLYAEDRRREKWERIDAAVDRLRQRYGYLSIRRARLDVHPELGRLNVRDDHVVHPVGYFGR